MTSRQSERLDDLQIGGLMIYQNPEAFCFGMDAVLLSGFARADAGENVLDLGTGNGILPLLLAAKTQAAHITGLEIQKESAELAVKSVKYNHLQERIDIICGDVREAPQFIAPGAYQVIVTNPPYIKTGSGLYRENARGIARHEICLKLRELMTSAGALLKEKGRLYMVHRPGRLPEILREMRGAGIEPKRLRTVHPRADKEAALILIEGIKGAGEQMILEPPLIISDENGNYTDEADEIYGIRHVKKAPSGAGKGQEECP